MLKMDLNKSFVLFLIRLFAFCCWVSLFLINTSVIYEESKTRGISKPYITKDISGWELFAYNSNYYQHKCKNQTNHPPFIYCLQNNHKREGESTFACFLRKPGLLQVKLQFESHLGLFASSLLFLPGPEVATYLLLFPHSHPLLSHMGSSNPSLCLQVRRGNSPGFSHTVLSEIFYLFYFNTR